MPEKFMSLKSGDLYYHFRAFVAEKVENISNTCIGVMQIDCRYLKYAQASNTMWSSSMNGNSLELSRSLNNACSLTKKLHVDFLYLKFRDVASLLPVRLSG